MSSTDHRKQSLYFPEDMLEEIQREATRQDRSLSWIVQQAWKVARGDIRKMPSVNDVLSPVPAKPVPVAPAVTPVPVAAIDGEPKP
ncbi:TIGR04563 family protein [Stigmatella aurantiaca]|uniref:Conserved uncharacterized protein n=1 Tax=Stigmatella aurantiaca (strain DW4/3-1) TaxID=378806 RepID=Q08SN8_STIAD|nr:TIGR04563 family protein [Stigmatella aurantiaca]ADO72517.1 conserved uncharacterized protein [Stigmatella aurantiaca DW4/3-1]EAU63481.1 hypothetical protein STIAU_6993 [Stigmatella aurantiaca DW4/3-1]